jgi:amino acid adenylation domain-containing protein
VPVIVRLTGKLNIGALQKSFERLIQRHEVLRTTFSLKDHAPVQSIATETILPLTVRDLSTLEGQDRELELRDCIAAAGRDPFDLAAGPLLRVQLLQLSAADYVLVLVLHHIISDGWSAGVLIQELAALYESFVSNCEASLSPLPIQYADFSVWQAGWLQGEELDRLLAYWSKQLAHSSSLRFPADYQMERGQPAQSGSCSRDLDGALSLKLKSLARQEGATDFMLLLAAFAAVLVRYTGQQDMNIGTPVAGRTHAELEPLLGFFVNTLVLRIKANGNSDFVELLKRVREVTIEAYEHQDLPFEKLVEKLQPAREAAHAPLFDVMFVLQNALRKVLRVPDLEMSQMEAEPAAGKFNLLLVMRDTEDGFKARLEYNASRFAASTMERFLSHFERLLRKFADAPGERLMEVQLLDASEQRQVLLEWNSTAFGYPSLPVHRIFEAHAQHCPDSVAIEVYQQRMSYAELNGKANQLACHLRKIGVGPEHRVAICLRRSADLVISLLATLKAGGVYVPLEASYPRERLAFMLENSAATVLITEHSLLERLPEPRIPVVHLDVDWSTITRHSDRNLALNVWPEQLAYIMYTSGSTGIPKGVAVTHRNIVRLTQENSFAAMTAQEVFFQFAPVSFDASTFEIWGALLNAAKLVICPVQDPSLSELGEIIQRHQVTTLWLTAGLFRLMVDEQLHSLSGLHQLLAGGDALSVPHVQRVIESLSCRLINGYGPTENTTFSCCHTLSPRERLGSSVPIGRPIANSEAYVLDEGMEPVPVGVMGELYVGGEGLARGYAGRPEMTAERFVPHPHSEIAGARLYRTGDWARYRENGELEFGGRKDGQVKIRGFRVELGEIEAALREHEGVKEAVAVVRGVEGEEQEKRIVAYVVAKEAGGVSGRELQEHVRAKLPEYMTPSGWALVEELPLTANGKVDREALGRYEEEREGEEEEYVEARTEVERKVAKLWQELLRLERISIHANFFDLGGHSLLATQIVSRLQQAFQVRIPLRMMFDSPTIAELAEDIEVLLWMAESGEALPPRAMKMEAGLSS